MTLRSLLLSFAGLLAATVAARAQETKPVAATNAPPPAFEVKTAREELPGLGVFYRAYLNAGTNKMAFLIPRDFGLRADAERRKVVLFDRDERCFITVQYLGPVPPPEKPGAPALKADTYRDTLLQRYPSAKVIEKFELAAGGKTGPAFDLALRDPIGAPRQFRAAFIPTAAGLVEFNLQTSVENFAAFLPAFNSLMITFRATAGGRLDIAPLSNKL